ncbi:TraI domain-containing protein [Paraburkholderia phenazinium]|uniref:TraI domain-containing protein n=1 Tax=Paraburkholderia phenazinium TaxID=60549 RepID=UPI00158F24AE|nr:TraI domain-containing protein [Paraburkholderia phenazinium]
MSGAALHKPVPAAELLAQTQNQRRIDLIRQCANEARESEFERRWLAVLERCARWFSTMPLNAELYREPGGAFRFTVETAFYAMRLAGGQKFGTTLSSEQRRRIEPQYNYAVFLAAVCSGLDEPYRHFSIVREPDQAEWNPSAHGGASAWLDGKAYVVRRRDTPLAVERMRTGMLAQMLIGQELLAGLDAAVLSEMFGAINPSPRPDGVESLIHKVVRHAIEVAADFDRKAQRKVFEPVAFSVPSAVHVAAALQPATAPPSPATTSAGASVAPATGAASPASSQAVPPAGPMSNATPSAAPGPSTSASTTAATRLTDPAGGVSPVPTVPTSLASLPEADETASPRVPAAAPDLAESAPGVDQLGLPFLSDDPAKLAAARPASINPADVPSAARERQVDSADFDIVLKDVPNMIRELFRLLREDVASGKATVRWDDKGLVVSKRLVGSYGIASETLVEHLRRRSLLVSNGNGEIIFGPRAGELILARVGA